MNFSLIKDWLIYSSKDPENLSLLIKGVVTWLILHTLAGYVGTAELSAFSETVVMFIQKTIEYISFAMMVWGASRKIFRTVEGKNAVVNSAQI